jgi:hypothetical protein
MLLLLLFLLSALLGVGIHMPSFDTTRATAIARKITQIQDEDHYGYCDCEWCVLQDHHCDELGTDECCSLCEHLTTLTECSQWATFDATRAYVVQDIRNGEIVYITHLYSQACKVLHRQRARAYFRVIER